MSGSRYPHGQKREDLDGLRIGHHFRLDPGRGEQEVDDRRRLFRRGRQSGGGETAGGVLFDDGMHGQSLRAKAIQECFGLRVAGDGYGEIGITGESGFRANGNGEAPDEGERRPSRCALRRPCEARLRVTSPALRVQLHDTSDGVSELRARALSQPLEKALVDLVRSGSRMGPAQILAHEIHASLEQVERRFERCACGRHG